MIVVRVDGALMRRVNKSRYLGLIVDNRLSWKGHMAYISSKISRNMGPLKPIRECVTKETLQILYTTLIEPYLRHSNKTWEYCETTLLKNLCSINLIGYHPPWADRRATNFFRQNPHTRDSFSVQNSGPRVKKTKQKSPPQGITCLVRMPR